MEILFARAWKWLSFCALSIVSAVAFTGCSTSSPSSPSWRQLTRQGELAAIHDDWDGAEKLYTAALEKAEQFRPGDYRLSRSLAHLTSVKVSLRKYPEAEALCRRQLQIDEKRGLTNNVYFVETLLSLAQIQAYQKQFDEAEELHLRAQSIIEFKYGYSTPVLGLLMAKRAAMYDMAGRYVQAEVLYASSKAKLDTLEHGGYLQPGMAMIQYAFLCNDYGLLKERMKKYPEAEALLLESISRLESEWGKKSPRLVTMLNNLARIYAKENKYDLADATIRRSISIVEKEMPSGNPVAADTRVLMTLISARQVQ